MNKILVTGSNGLVGSALRKILGENHIYHTKEDVNLLDNKSTIDYITHHVKYNNVDTVIHCAAKVGGVQANMKNNKGFFIDNFIINNNIIEASFKNEIPNFVNLLSTCIFPDKNITFPLTPSQIDQGPPHFSNHGYAYAKRLSGYQTNIIKKVLNANWVSVVPTNVYGINDNFHLDDGHMIPAMIHRAHLSKQNSEKMVIWGDGSPLRQVIYSEDLAKLIMWSLENWKNDEPFMAINRDEHSILNIAKIICNSFDIENEDIVFDSSKPMGQHRKPAISNAPDDFNFTELSVGIKETVNWFKQNYENIRK
jgi:GDP-L-fucose synthase